MINNVAENLTGWKPQEAMGQPLANVFNIMYSVDKQINTCKSMFAEINI